MGILDNAYQRRGATVLELVVPGLSPETVRLAGWVFAQRERGGITVSLLRWEAQDFHI